EYYNDLELRELTHDLGIDYQNLSGETKRARLLSLIQYTKRHNKSDELLELVIQKRSFLRHQVLGLADRQITTIEPLLPFLSRIPRPSCGVNIVVSVSLGILVIFFWVVLAPRFGYLGFLTTTPPAKAETATATSTDTLPTITSLPIVSAAPNSSPTHTPAPLVTTAPTAPSTDTPIPPTPQPNDTNTPLPTVTPTNTPVPTVIATPTTSPPSEPIAFVFEDSIFLLDANDPNNRDSWVRLTDAGGRDWLPSWGFDGRIIFQSDRTGMWQFYLINSDGSNLTTIPSEPDFGQPKLSPSGEQITFFQPVNGNNEIFVMNTDGSNLRQITTFESNTLWSDWSPDGNSLAFQSQADRGRWQIFTVDLNDPNLTPRQLTSFDQIQNSTPDWSPDGTKLAFVSSREFTNWGLYTMNADGSTQELIFTLDDEDILQISHPAWSQDSSQIAFQAQNANQLFDFYIFTFATGVFEKIELDNDLGANPLPSWRP
ncbi:MAG: hypothetical protein GY805_14905, partial [Chloroflexi bacterium]|nr:hypothetical protein [Chloroflexota bacterium]